MRTRIYEKATLGSLLADKDAMDDIRDMVAGGQLHLPPGLASEPGGLESIGTEPSPEARLESMATSATVPGEANALEAIVLLVGRPTLLVGDDTFAAPELPTWQHRLEAYRDVINGAIRSVARLEILNHPSFDYLGTAWMLTDDLMITNRHVANLFARKIGTRITFRTNPLGHVFQTQVDFKEEYQQSADPFEVPVKEVIHMEDDRPDRPDLALIRIENVAGLPDPIPLTSNPVVYGEDVAVIGYPARDPRNDATEMERIFDGIYDVKRLAPGKISGREDDPLFFNHDCTTLGGSSGSVVVRIPTGEAVGLHFSGAYLQNNYAVQPAALLDRLSRLRASVHIPEPPAPDIAGLPSVVEEAAPTRKSLRGRRGYNEDFLGMPVALPSVFEDVRDEVAPLKLGRKTELKYMHYSVVMHRTRRMAILTAVNINGKRWWHIPRGSDRWYYDPRMDPEFQMGNELYKYNRLQRGHLVRRLDPSWGSRRSTAEKAVEDTFFWTNCTPQHEEFNPRSWLRLEEYVLDNAIAHDLRVTVFTGPIFRDTDKTYRDSKIPEDYWKVLVTLRSDTGQLSATSYILSQSAFMDDLEYLYGEYKTYQVPLQTVMDMTRIDFEYLMQHDPLSRIEAIPFIEIASGDDILF